jgi:hypothetical protein
MENPLFAATSSFFTTSIFRRVMSYDSDMAEPLRVSPDLPELDRTDDPRGGAVAWAVLIVTTAMIAGAVVSLVWFW